MTELDVLREGRVLRLALNRPDKRNALSAELCSALADEVERADSDAEVGCILLEARGEVFCSGMDLGEALSVDAGSLAALHERLLTIGLRMSKPLVAAVAGPAMGGGLGLIANAHIAIAAHGCNFALAEIRVGMWPFIIWRTIVQALGERRAIALSLTGRVFGVNEALQWGLVHEVAPAFELEDRALATAHHLAESSPAAIRLGLSYVNQARGLTSDAGGTLAAEFRKTAFASEDFQEGLAAFREKRKPVWPSVNRDRD